MSESPASFSHHAVCDAFERAWQAGTAPAIEAVLQANPAVDRQLLLEELIAVEAYRRARGGEPISVEDYRQRFPEVAERLPELLHDAMQVLRENPASTATLISSIEEPTVARPSTPPGSFNPAEPSVGQQLGPYRLVKKLGAGGMGTVWEAVHLRLEKTVALKLLSPQLMADPGLVSRFDREMKAVGKLEHPHLVRAYDAGDDRGVHYLAMEYIDGMDLARYVRERGPLSVQQTLHVMIQAAEGLAEAHRAHMVHRDIKPANLMLTRKGVVKVTDLGLARLQSGGVALNDGTLTAAGQILGTPDFMAPEQWDDTHAVDGRCDLYALGCTLFFLLTSSVPFRAQSSLMQKMRAHLTQPMPDLVAERQAALERIRSSNNSAQTLPAAGHDLPEALVSIYQRLIAKDPQQRFATADELMVVLRGIASPTTITANAATSTTMPPITFVTDIHLEKSSSNTLRPRKRAGRRVWSVVAAMMGGIAVIGGIFTLWNLPPVGKTPKRTVKTEGAKNSDVSANPVMAPDAGFPQERAVARSILSKLDNDGDYFVLLNADGSSQKCQKGGQLPSKDFRVTHISRIGSATVTDADVRRWASDLSSLEYLRLQGCSQITDAALVGLEKQQALHDLLVDGTSITSSKLTSLIPLCKLHVLGVHAQEVSEELLQAIAVSPTLKGIGVRGGTEEQFRRCLEVPQLKQLMFDGLQASPETYRRIATSQPLLNILVLSYSNISDTDLQTLVPLRELLHLELSGSKGVTDAGIEHLAQLTSLTGLPLGNTLISAEGAERLHAALPHCWIAWSGGSIGPGEPSSGPGVLKSAEKTGWHGWPADAPKPAIAPFDADQATKHQKEWAAYLKVPVEYTNSVGIKLRLIPPGEFLMGNTAEESEAVLQHMNRDKVWEDYVRSESPQHRVVLTQPIYLGVYEVTQADYERVMGQNPSLFVPTGPNQERARRVAGMDTTSHPVEMVSWNDAAEFCAKLSQQEKLKPFYFRGDERVTSLNGTGCRLPTEAEWEFACRAGTTTRYWFGEKDEELARAGWFKGNSGGRTHAVGSLESNPFGLFDTHGNVAEWVHDEWVPDSYARFHDQPAINPSGQFGVDSQRIHRDAGYYFPEPLNRAAARRNVEVTFTNESVGFRVGLPVDAVKAAIAIHSTNPVSKGGRSADVPVPANAPSGLSRTPDYAQERAIAESVLTKSGAEVLFVRAKRADGTAVYLKKSDPLPDGDLVLYHIQLLNSPTVTDADVRRWTSSLSALRFLQLSECVQITDAALDEMPPWSAFDELKVGNTAITSRKLVSVVQQCQVQGLAIDCRQLSDELIDMIISKAELQRFELGDGSDEQFQKVLTIPRLTELHVSGGKTTPEKYRRIAQTQPMLDRLTIADSRLSDSDLESLATLTKLRDLDLNRSIGISDRGLKSLARCPSLLFLNLVGTAVTQAGIDQLHAALPRSRIFWNGGAVEPTKPADAQ